MSMPPACARRAKKTTASPCAARAPKNSPRSDALQVAQTANAALMVLYWEIGTRIHQDV
jgi:hypothetical protein